MKKIVLTVAGLLCFFLAEAQQFGQKSRSTSPTEMPNNVKINVLSPIVRTINGSFEHYFNKNQSFQLGIFYNNLSLEDKNFWIFDVPEARYTNLAFTPEFRFYMGSPDRANSGGFYLAPFGRYQNTGIKIKGKTENGTEYKEFNGHLNTIRLGGVAGYKFIIGERVSLEAFAGPSIRVANWLNSNINTYKIEDFNPFGFTIRSGINLGIQF